MNITKKYYNALIESMINELINKKEEFVQEINDLASMFEYHDRNDNVSLSEEDIQEINKKRQQVFAIYQLIEDLEKLR